jgi:hypothetical protein
MNDAYDQLEAELAALRPNGASAHLRRRIAEHRAHSVPPRSRWWWGLARAGGLAAACAAAAILLHLTTRQPVVPGRTVARAHPVLPVEVEDSAPTRWAYWRALARSPEELDALLDKVTMVPPHGNPERVRIGAFTRSDAALHALLGED